MSAISWRDAPAARSATMAASRSRFHHRRLTPHLSPPLLPLVACLSIPVGNPGGGLPPWQTRRVPGRTEGARWSPGGGVYHRDRPPGITVAEVPVGGAGASSGGAGARTGAQPVGGCLPRNCRRVQQPRHPVRGCRRPARECPAACPPGGGRREIDRGPVYTFKLTLSLFSRQLMVARSWWPRSKRRD